LQFFLFNLPIALTLIFVTGCIKMNEIFLSDQIEVG